ncbi:hypothetical protein N8Z24_00065 [bacterium]|nr:hypothetical protein [bacterium]
MDNKLDTNIEPVVIKGLQYGQKFVNRVIEVLIDRVNMDQDTSLFYLDFFLDDNFRKAHFVHPDEVGIEWC